MSLEVETRWDVNPRKETLRLLRLLFICGHLSKETLKNAGAGCEHRAVDELLWAGIIAEDSGCYKLSRAGVVFMREFVVTLSPHGTTSIAVDIPHAFIVMPFGEPWSDCVLTDLIKPACSAAGFSCERADQAARVGDLAQGVWNGIMTAGLVIVEVSVPNVNVFYELGLARAIGRDTLLLRQKDPPMLVPADIRGMLYCEYDLQHLETGKNELARQLREWAKKQRAFEVRSVANEHHAGPLSGI